MYIQRFYLYLNMTKPSELLVLSWARMNLEGRALQKELSGGSGAAAVSDDSDRKAGAGAHAFTGAVFFGWTEYLANGLRSYADGLLDEAAGVSF